MKKKADLGAMGDLRNFIFPKRSDVGAFGPPHIVCGRLHQKVNKIGTNLLKGLKKCSPGFKKVFWIHWAQTSASLKGVNKNLQILGLKSSERAKK